MDTAKYSISVEISSRLKATNSFKEMIHAKEELTKALVDMLYGIRANDAVHTCD